MIDADKNKLITLETLSTYNNNINTKFTEITNQLINATDDDIDQLFALPFSWPTGGCDN